MLEPTEQIFRKKMADTVLRHREINTQIILAQHEKIAQARQSKNEALLLFQEQDKRDLNETSAKFDIPDYGIYEDEQDRIEHELYRIQTTFDLINKQRIQMQEMEIARLQAEYERSKDHYSVASWQSVEASLRPKVNRHAIQPRDQSVEASLRPKVNRHAIQSRDQLKMSASKECGFCKRNGEGLKACSRCNVVYYCNQECQKSHWKLHKPNCALTAHAPEALIEIPSGAPKIPKQDYGSAPKSFPRPNPVFVPGVANRRAQNLPNLLLTTADVSSIQNLIAVTNKWTEINMDILGCRDADHLNLSISNYGLGNGNYKMVSFHTNLSGCIGAILTLRKRQLVAAKGQKLTRILRYDGNCWMNLVQTFNPRTYMQTQRYHIYSEEDKDDVNFHIDDELDEINRALRVLDGSIPAELVAFKKRHGF